MLIEIAEGLRSTSLLEYHYDHLCAGGGRRGPEDPGGSFLYGPPVRVDWRVRSKPDGGWVITDAVIEGVSMTITQRNEFGAVIRNSGGEVEGLLAKLRELTGSGKERSADRQTRKDAL